MQRKILEFEYASDNIGDETSDRLDDFSRIFSEITFAQCEVAVNTISSMIRHLKLPSLSAVAARLCL